MFIHRENALKRPSIYIIIVLYKEITLKKQLYYKMGSKYSSRHIKLHIFSKFSRVVACPLACVQLISLFLYEKSHFFIQNAMKIYTKTHKI